MQFKITPAPNQTKVTQGSSNRKKFRIENILSIKARSCYTGLPRTVRQ
jgi:hypothetical protein